MFILCWNFNKVEEMISSRAPRVTASVDQGALAICHSIKQRQNGIYCLNTAIQWTEF